MSPNPMALSETFSSLAAISHDLPGEQAAPHRAGAARLTFRSNRALVGCECSRAWAWWQGATGTSAPDVRRRSLVNARALEKQDIPQVAQWNVQLHEDEGSPPMSVDGVVP